MRILEILRDWAEVWAMLIPLSIILFYKPAGNHIRIVVGYVIIAFFLFLIANLMLEFYDILPERLLVNGGINNNLIYNIHSVIKVLLFSWYIMSVRDYKYLNFLKLLLVVYLGFVILNFYQWETPLKLSTHLFTAESIVLLVMCFFYFFRSIQDDSQENWLKHPSFLVCSGVCLYEVICFFIFLFFWPLAESDEPFFIVTMRIYSFALVLLGIMLALAFYKSHRANIQLKQVAT